MPTTTFRQLVRRQLLSGSRPLRHRQLVGSLIFTALLAFAGCSGEESEEAGLSRVRVDTPVPVDASHRMVFDVPLEDKQAGVWNVEAGAPTNVGDSDGTSIRVTVGDQIVFEGSGVRSADSVRFEFPLPRLRVQVEASIDGTVVADRGFGPVAPVGGVHTDVFLELDANGLTQVVTFNAHPQLGRDLGWVAINADSGGGAIVVTSAGDAAALVRFDVVDVEGSVLVALENTVSCFPDFMEPDEPPRCQTGFGLVVPDGAASIIASIDGETIGEFDAGTEPPTFVSVDLFEDTMQRLEWSASDDGTTELIYRIGERTPDGEARFHNFWESGNGMRRPMPVEMAPDRSYELWITDGLHITVVPIPR